MLSAESIVKAAKGDGVRIDVETIARVRAKQAILDGFVQDVKDATIEQARGRSTNEYE